MNRKIFIYSLIALALSILLSNAVYATGTMPPHKYIPLRVLVIKKVSEVEVHIKGSYRILDSQTKEVLKEGGRLQKFAIKAGDIGAKGIMILPQKRTRIYINGRHFRGNIDIIKQSAAELIVINHVDLEEYLYGVLYHEVSHRWPIEVLKAQAIAARTYALYQKLISQKQDYDLASDIYSQVYGGRSSETWRTTLAVNLTQGIVLTYEGKLIPAYYHATCGGRTSRASTLWNIDIPALRGVVCNFCTVSPHYRWAKELTKEFIQEKLKNSGYGINIISILITEKDESGRILKMVFKGKDTNIELTGNKFRLLMDPNIIRSTNFEIVSEGKLFKFYGKGWGHGIGMCQWGAYNMAKNDWKAGEILRYYYPETDITRLE